MSFWKKVKGFFGGDGGGEEPPAGSGGGELPGHDPALVDEVVIALRARCLAKTPFEAVDVADEVTINVPNRSVAQIRAACAVVEALHDAGWFSTIDYTRTRSIYHHVASPPAAYVPPRGASSFPPPGARQPVPPPVAQPAPPRAATSSSSSSSSAPAVDPLAAGAILGLSPAELRKRALTIRPYETAWIGRVDTIPPQSDERTAIIDRGLILRGMLTPEQITEIHRVGDIWLRHHHAAKLAEIAAQASADVYLQQQRAEKAALKAEKKRLTAEKKAARVALVAKRRAEDIIYLGRGVSGGLADRRSLVEELARRELPMLGSPADVARALGLTVTRLRWLAFHAEAPTRTHYVYFEIPKRTGGTRLLSAPHDDLKKAQHWILENILAKLSVTDAAHGFVPGRSVVSNAAPHLGRDVIVNCDLKDFFPSISVGRVRGVFETIGYSPAVATVLALLCTEAPRTRVTHDGNVFWVAVGPRALPQGAPTSPALSNQIARKLDQRFIGLGRKMGWAYTRYADDLTFSAGPGQRDKIGYLLARIRHIAQDEGFAMNPKKCRVQRAARRQEVTGIVVNDKLSLPRDDLRRLRAIVHGARKTGIAAQNRDSREDFEAWLRGKIAYVSMVDAAKGERLRVELDGAPP
ncbi:MAG: Retron-type RNA-directed polymerase [Myxococcaceae bacterium]|nr:Retron-type RNA-directed polymerase [Myxococcaceae bacterium]MEA2752565.1 RNA-directed polymerase [Myxococcales bacterium]